MPLVRGSGFILKSSGMNPFYKYQVITAGHVSCPVKYPAVFGRDSPALKAIGERHITSGLVIPRSNINSDSGDAGPHYTHPLIFLQKRFLNTDVALLHVKDEDAFFATPIGTSITPLELDADPVGRGEELVFHGVQSTESPSNPSDDGLRVEDVRIGGSCHSRLNSIDYGSVLLAHADAPIPPTLCGGPVLRKSNGKCVGVIVARTLAAAPPVETAPNAPPNQRMVNREPWMDISETPELRDAKPPIHAAFVPVQEFLSQLRKYDS